VILAIDAGNSTVSFGFFDKDNLKATFRAEARMGATPDEYWSFITSQMGRAGIGRSEVTGIVISSVVPPLVPVFFEALKGICPSLPLVVSNRLKLGIKIRYSTPDTLGSDRLCSTSAAYAIHGGPVIVADFGTATTFSVVDRDGTFIGGAIAPGLLTGYSSLIERTAGLPRVGLTFPKSAIGSGTGEGLTSGIIFGHASMAEGMVGRLRKEMGADAKCVATGGLAGMVAPHAPSIKEADPHLALKGLAGIYKMNS